jgi:hypothetical protein
MAASTLHRCITSPFSEGREKKPHAETDSRQLTWPATKELSSAAE